MRSSPENASRRMLGVFLFVRLASQFCLIPGWGADRRFCTGRSTIGAFGDRSYRFKNNVSNHFSSAWQALMQHWALGEGQSACPVALARNKLHPKKHSFQLWRREP